MKGTFFGYRDESPCPHCGTPRVGADYDDDYYVIPGIVETRTATCDQAQYEETFSPPDKTRQCEGCGEPLEWRYTERRTSRGQVRYWRGRCPNAHDEEVLRRLPGCERCRREGHHIPLLSE